MRKTIATIITTRLPPATSVLRRRRIHVVTIMTITTIHQRSQQLPQRCQVHLSTRFPSTPLQQQTFQKTTKTNAMRRRRNIGTIALQTNLARLILTLTKLNLNIMSSHFFIPTKSHMPVIVEIARIPFGNLVFKKLPELLGLPIHSQCIINIEIRLIIYI